MTTDKRVLVIVAVAVLASTGLFFFSSRISDLIYPPPEIQSDGFGGEVLPGGEATKANFEKIRRGMKRHEVWSILGESSGVEGGHAEWWDGPGFGISLLYDEHSLVADGSIHIEDGRKIELRK